MYTVEMFLESLRTMGVPWYKVLSGRSVLGTNVVENISVNEHPIENFVRKNEVVLSIATGCENEDTFLSFINDLYKVGASALVLSRPENEITLPKNVSEFLSENPFPVILVPWHYRYVDIVKSVFEKVHKDAIEELRQYEGIQRNLLDAYLANKSLDFAAKLLAEQFHSRIIIFSALGAVKGTSSHFSHFADGDLRKLFEDSEFTIEIKANDRLYGKIFLQPLSQSNIYKEALFLHYLLLPLTLWFDREWLVYITKQRARDDFIWNLTKTGLDKYEEVCKEGEKYGFSLHGAYTCVVGSIALINSPNIHQTEVWLASNIDSVKEEILQVARIHNWEALLTYQQGEIVLFLQPLSEENKTVDGFLDLLERAMLAVFPQILFAWGIGELGDNPTDFCKCFQTAKLAKEFCKSSSQKNTRYAFKNTFIYNLTSILISNSDLYTHAEKILSPLYESDVTTGSELIRTLKAYLQYKTISEAARQLHLHRHSLLYRLNKIEELTGLSLKSAENLFVYEVCIRMFENNL